MIRIYFITIIGMLSQNSLFSYSKNFAYEKCNNCSDNTPVESLYKKFNKFMPIEEKNFVFIVPSYNNSEWYIKNISSIFNQNYSNYRVIYIDDASTDNTGTLVKNFVEKIGKI